MNLQSFVTLERIEINSYFFIIDLWALREGFSPIGNPYSYKKLTLLKIGVRQREGSKVRYLQKSS